MAWGYWTTYSTYAIRQTGRENQRALSPPAKRERSLERESRERERQAGGSSGGQGESGSRTPGSFGLGSSGGSAGGSLVHRPYPPQQQSNHVEAEKVAFERRLLLGDPDWSSRTVADRNTLPRKKAHEYDRGSTSEGIYGKNGHSPVTTPVDSGSRKSDEMFCPACAQHSATQSNNRDSRVSFGSVASSSRGSRGSSSARGGSAAVPIPMRSRSRSHDDDERSSCSRGGGESGGGAGAFSSSLPTPPPPPFSSQRDILQQHSALMETINQKISILSSFKQQQQQQQQQPKYHTMGPEHHSYRSSRHDQHSRAVHDQHHHHQQPQHRRSSSNVRSSADDPAGASLDHSSSSLHDRAESRRRRSEGASKSGGSSRSTARKSSRRSSGSRTPRGNSGSASSRRSRESIGSSERKTNISSGSATAVVPRRRSSSERIDDDYDEDRDGGDEESDDVDNNNIGKVTADRPVTSTHSASSSSPKELPLHRESLEKVIARQVVAVAAAAAAAAKSSKPPEQISRDPKEIADVEGEDYGTVRRKTRRRSKEDRLSMGEIEERGSGNGAVGTSNSTPHQPSVGSLRSSQSQTPDDDDSAVNNSSEAQQRTSCRRHGSTKSRSNRGDSGGSSKHLASDDAAVTLQQPPPPPPPATLISAITDRIPFSLSLKKGGGSKPPLPPPPQPFHHFKHYDHREHPSSSGHCDFLIIDDKQQHVAAPPLSTSHGSSGTKPAADCCRPRSASIGNHLSDADVEVVTAAGADYHNNSTFPHRRDGRSTSSRRHHTLDGYSRSGYSGGSSGGQAHGGARRGDVECYDSEEVFLAHGRRLASMTSFHSSATTGVASSRSVSSKSEKSSRSSQSPSVENLRHGMIFISPDSSKASCLASCILQHFSLKIFFLFNHSFLYSVILRWYLTMAF